MKQFVGTLVIAPNGNLLCQLRDDIPGIIHRGCWTCCPGGTVEQEETPIEAVCREMKEEFNIEIKKIELLTTYTLDGEFAGSYSIFTSKLASPISQIQCNEGQKAEFFSPQDALKVGLPNKTSTWLLKKYLAKFEVNV
jgi:8-oxo-dGTP diphosphatase